MKGNLIEIHSARAKFATTIYLIYIIVFSFLLLFLSYEWIFSHNPSNFIVIGSIALALFISAAMYHYSFLGYLDSKNHILILKKPYRKKEWKIKLERITNIEKVRLFIVRGKHIKISTYNKDKTDSVAYYILSSRLSSFLGFDDAKFLWEEVLKRKKELNEKEQTTANNV